MKNNYILLLVIILLSCNSPSNNKEPLNKKIEIAEIPTLNISEATRLAKLPLNCMEVEYPNRLGQTLGGIEDLQSPKNFAPFILWMF